MKKKQKRVKVVDEQLEEVEEIQRGAVSEVEEAPKKKLKNDTMTEEEKKEETVEEEKKKDKGKGKGWIALIIILVLFAGGAFVAKSILLKTTTENETVKVSDDARGFSNYFKEYLADRIEIEKIISTEYDKLDKNEALSKLSSLKDGFSKVARGTSGNYIKSVYAEMATVMENDASLCLTLVRELRSILNDDDKKAFEEKVAETKEGLRSALYVARAAFKGDVTGLSSKGVVAFEGGAMVEAGGGVMNIFVGDFQDGIVAVSSDMMEDAKSIEAEKLYGYNGIRVIVIGDSMASELESGWFKNIKLEIGSLEAKMTKTKVSFVLKSLSNVEDELKGMEIKGLVEEGEKTINEQLTEAVAEIKGKR